MNYFIILSGSFFLIIGLVIHRLRLIVENHPNAELLIALLQRLSEDSAKNNYICQKGVHYG